MKSIKILSVMIVFSISILAGEWTLTGSLNQSRRCQQDVLLPDGHSVLIVGGWVGGVGPTSSCEIWSRETGQWTYTDSLPISLANFVMVKLELETGVEYLTIGGSTGSAQNLGMTNRCFRYNPKTKTWRETGSMNRLRCFHAATTFRNSTNKIFVMAGGGFDVGNNNSCEIYDPITEKWIFTEYLNDSRDEFTLTTLSGDSILAVGGNTNKTAEIWSPVTMSWSYTSFPNHNRYRSHTATKISPKEVLIIGGWSWEEQKYLKSCEIYNQNTGTFIETDSLEIGRAIHLAKFLPNGKILVSGGYNSDRPPNPVKISTEVYNPETGLWQTDADMNLGRENHTSTLLLDGRVLAVGSGGVMPQTELYSWNHQPSVTEIQCLENGFVGDTLSLRVRVTDPDNDSVSARFICSPGDTSEWSEFLPSESIFEKFHCYDSGGIYQIQIQVRDQWHCQGIHNSLSDWISGPVVHIRDLSLNQSPEITQPQGPTQGFVNDTLMFNVNIADPENDSVSVRFSWGNQDTSDWSEYQPSESQFEIALCWTDTGTYDIDVQTKDIWEMKGEWNKTFTIVISDSNDVGICFNPLILKKLELFQNFPNPFNQSTTINYQVPKDTEVEIIIYNLMGQKVKALESGFKRAGYYSLQWNGQNEYGKNEPSGVYIYQLITPNRIVCKKMVFAK